MRHYWLRIGGGALLIFAVGMGMVVAGRRGVERAKEYIRSANSFNVPIALLPFKLNGRTVGSIRQIQVDRDGPSRIRSINLTVRLDDLAALDRLGDCALSAHGLRDFNDRTTFLCESPAESSGDLVPFGRVTFQPTGVVREIRVTPAEAREFNLTPVSAPSVPSAPAGRPAVVTGSAVDLRADAAGALLQIRDRNGRQVVQLNADSGGAFLRIRDEKGREVVKLRADSGGLLFHLLGDSGKRIDIHADSSGARATTH